jgi:Fungal chitosanase of glycosyl hydrolase group 75
MLKRSLIWTTVIVAGTATLHCQASGVSHPNGASLDEDENECLLQVDTFPLGKQDLTVIRTDGGVLFSAGMTIDADGAPNAYGPHNRGLDYTANARNSQGWAALVTNENGRPVIQKRGPYRGYYVSTTSLQQSNVSDLRSPKRYIDATKVPYVALPQDFARAFDIHLGDLAVVVNRANGRTAYAIFADVGPRGRIGEGSIALAKALDMPADPRHSSVSGGVIYLIFPGSELPADGRVTARNVRSSAGRLFRRWGGREKLLSCRHPLLQSTSIP